MPGLIWKPILSPSFKYYVYFDESQICIFKPDLSFGFRSCISSSLPWHQRHLRRMMFKTKFLIPNCHAETFTLQCFNSVNGNTHSIAQTRSLGFVLRNPSLPYPPLLINPIFLSILSILPSTCTSNLCPPLHLHCHLPSSLTTTPTVTS